MYLAGWIRISYGGHQFDYVVFGFFGLLAEVLLFFTKVYL